jgi:hypothetical protein
MPRDKVRPWTWNASRELAAQLVADKQLTNVEIAKRAGVTDSQLNRWKLTPEFAARADEHRATFRAGITTTGLALKENRIADKKERVAALQRVRQQRAEVCGQGEPLYNPVTGLPLIDKKTNAPIVVPIPGGDTGLVVRQPRAAGVQFSVDGVLLASISALEKEIAIEMGDWKTKSQMEVVDGPSLVDILRDRRLRRAHLAEQDAAEEKAAAKAAEPEAKLELEYGPSGRSDQQGVTHVLQSLLTTAPRRQAQFCKFCSQPMMGSDTTVSCDTRSCVNFGKPALYWPPTP